MGNRVDNFPWYIYIFCFTFGSTGVALVLMIWLPNHNPCKVELSMGQSGSSTHFEIHNGNFEFELIRRLIKHVFNNNNNNNNNFINNYKYLQ